MKHTLTSKAAELMRKNGRHRRWRRAFSGMAAVVVFITTYMLILPAITMENKAICGMAEHTHTDACYEMQLVCTQEETPEGADVHVHGPECYEQQQVLTCTKQEGEGHTHTDACYGYVCGQEESAGHTHTDACYTEVTHRELTCTEPESAGHTHGDGCYDEEGKLVCTEAESTGHTHGDSCYTETVTRELTCGQEESSGHTHTDACIGLICGQEEYEGHTHTDACYTTEDVLVCTEPTGHTHGDGCYEKVLVCDVPEHTHTEECYPAAEPEEPQEPELICTLPEHSHEDACYDADGNLICGMEEHTHTEECYAPVEIPEEETPTTAFPDEKPEGYVEYTFDNEAGLTVTAYAPEGAFGQDVQLFAQVLPEDSEEYAQAKENLDKAENAPEYTGMAAMDIRFVDAAAEDPAQAEEIEPDAEMGQVFVKIDAQALLPEDVDESTLAVQHHVETESDKIFGVIPDFIHPETITVETVADNTEETGDITATPGETALPETLPALAGEPEMAEAATLEEPAAETETEETQPAAMNVEAEFAVNSFSTFTITYNVMPLVETGSNNIIWTSNQSGRNIQYKFINTASLHVVDERGNEIGEYVTIQDNIGKAEVSFQTVLNDLLIAKGKNPDEYIVKDFYFIRDNVEREFAGDQYGNWYIWYDNNRNYNFGMKGLKATFGDDELIHSGDQYYIVLGDSSLALVDGENTKDQNITINLFNYNAKEINRIGNKNRTLQFSEGDGSGDVNIGTGSSKPKTGIVSGRLENGYPVISSKYSYSNESLAYLFDATSVSGKTSYLDLDGLFQLDENGYYYYDSAQNFATLVTPSYNSNGDVITQNSDVIANGNKQIYLYNQPGQYYHSGSAEREVYFLPFNGFRPATDAKYSSIVDYHFGMTIEVPFTMPKNGQVNGEDMIFEFRGDDDVWVFVDGTLALDLGGLHNAASGSINFNTGAVTVNGEVVGYLWDTTAGGRNYTGLLGNKKWSNYSDHTLKFFYLERGAYASNCKITFNLVTVPENSLIIAKDLDTTGAQGNSLDYLNNLDFTFRILNSTATANSTDDNDLFIKEGATYTVYKEGQNPGTDEGEQRTVRDSGIITLKAGQFAVFNGILANASAYKVQELIPTEYDAQYDSVKVNDATENIIDTEVTIGGTPYKSYITSSISPADEQDNNVTFYNKINWEQISYLDIQKVTEGTIPANNSTFYFKVMLGDDTGLTENGGEWLGSGVTYQVLAAGGYWENWNDVESKTTNDAGLIQLTSGQTARLPVLSGTEFYIVETDSSGTEVVSETDWEVRYSASQSGIVPNPGQSISVTVTNIFPVLEGNLSITKTVARTDGVDPSGSGFRFEITLSDGKTPSTNVTGKFSYTVTGNQNGGKITFADGVITSIDGPAADSERITEGVGQASTTKYYVKLDHDQTITIQDLPGGTVATIKEVNYSGYAPAWKNTVDPNAEETTDPTSDIQTNAGDTVTTVGVSANDPIEVTCTNTTGAVLPSTGGMGTTPFLALGTLLTLGAGMLLVQRRRKEGSDAV